jgi:hypothetical protein
MKIVKTAVSHTPSRAHDHLGKLLGWSGTIRGEIIVAVTLTPAAQWLFPTYTQDVPRTIQAEPR